MTLTQIPSRFTKSAPVVRPTLRNGNFDQRAANYKLIGELKKLKREQFLRANSVSIFTP